MLVAPPASHHVAVGQRHLQGKSCTVSKLHMQEHPDLGPCCAHSGILAAAKAVWADLEEHGILGVGGPQCCGRHSMFTSWRPCSAILALVVPLNCTWMSNTTEWGCPLALRWRSCVQGLLSEDEEEDGGEKGQMDAGDKQEEVRAAGLALSLHAPMHSRQLPMDTGSAAKLAAATAWHSRFARCACM